MKRRNIGYVLAVAVAAAQPAAAQGQKSLFTGHWHWNKAQSVLPPGESPVNDLVTDIDRVDSTHVRWSMTTIDAKGRKGVESFDTPANGDFYPISADTVAAFTLTPSSMQGTFKDSTGQVDVLTCTLSSNGAKMTCNGAMTLQDGTVAHYVDVFDRS